MNDSDVPALDTGTGITGIAALTLPEIAGVAALTAAERPESVSRFSRWNSARISEAC